MLEPGNRRLLLDALRPPAGYRLDQAIGTSFSLDLIAMMVAPLGFTLFDWEDERGRPTSDPYALLAALREHADRMSIFCQVGQIAVPPAHQLLVSELEDSIIEVRAPRGGVFHPKIWLLRYVSDGEAVTYRFLCLTRNLTFDRSWDALLTLDGVLTARRNAFTVNHPLGDFIAALPGLAIRSVQARTRNAAALMEHEVRRVDFALPDGVERIAFWPLGLSRDVWPFQGDIRRLMVISPFLTPRALVDLAGDGSGSDVLISRFESLEQLDADQLDGFMAIHVLHDGAQADHGEANEPALSPNGSDPSAGQPVQGLHAKIYVADAGWNARMWVGSANATSAAFGRNVEFLVELEGKKSHLGVDRCLSGNDGSVGLGELLVPYEPRQDAAPLSASERLQRLADDARRALAEAPLRLTVEPAADGRHLLRLFSEEPLHVPDASQLSAWPATQNETTSSRELALDASVAISYGPMPLEHVTPFVAFRLRITDGEETAEARFVLKLALESDPAGRRDAVLRALIETPSGLLRFLLLMLSDSTQPGSTAELAAQVLSAGGRDAGADALVEIPLLEALVQTLEREPAKLRQIARIIEDLSRTEQGQRILGQELPAIWAPILAALEETEV